MLRIRKMLSHYLNHWLGYIVLLAAAGVGDLFLALHYASADSAKLATIAASAVAAFGVTWKGIGNTLGKAISQAQQPLWEAEVDIALALAITHLPGEVYPSA